MDIITVTQENLEQEHICCAISNNNDCQVASKKEWLSERFKDGLVFKKCDVRGKCFIEYIPAEKAWSPIQADGYMFINCLWVSGKFKGHGYSNLLLEECIKDSKEQEKKGLVILSAKKKMPFLADPKYLKYKGFELADNAEPYFELLYLSFDESAAKPSFKPLAKEPKIEEMGFVLYYTHQCPFIAKYAPLIEKIAKDKGITMKTYRYKTTKEAQNAPVPFTSYSLFYNGEFVTKALDGVSLSLEPGEVFGFLGPNGAGKTTAIKLLNGMLSPTEGSCRVFGISPAESPEKVHQISGVVTEHAQMYDNLTGLQNLIFYGSVFGIGTSESKKRAQELLEELNLTDARGKKLAAYSTGMRQRLSLARALIHSPKMLFLDEPTSGLDPESAQSVNSMIKGLARNQGTTIFLCTHQLRYAQEICSTYGLIDDGTLLAVDSIEHLRSLVSSATTAQIKADHFPEDLLFRKIKENTGEIDLQSEEEIPELIKRIVDTGGRIYSVSSRRLSLEEIYFALLEKRKIKKEVTE